jgi:dUTP pyrophosphatase
VRHGVTVLNAPGTIDADYRGEIKVALVNLGQQPVELARGHRIAQMVVASVTQVRWTQVDVLDETSRGNRGFGSTGID